MIKRFLSLSVLIAMFAFIGCTEPTESQTVLLYEKAEESKEEYKIVFNANGGSGTMETISIKAETSIVLPTNTFKRTNYYFIGWSTTEDGEVMFKNADIFQGLYSDITLYAVWQQNPIPEKSTIIFNANGGIGVMEKLTVTVDTPMKLSANTFTRTGYIFAGWAEEKDGTKKYDNQAEITLENDDGIILYAVWEAITYKIQFSTNLDESLNVTNPETITIAYDKAFKLPVLEDIDGQYYFKGWNTEADGKGENYLCENEIKNLTSQNNAVLKLYARWSREGEYIINYVLDGGINDSGNQSSFYEENSVWLYNPTHPNESYSFVGWYEDEYFSGDSISYWDPYEKQSDVTLYAKWDKPTYKVTLVSKVDGENTVSVSVNATIGSNMPKIVVPYRNDDYSFGGYFTQENGMGEQYYNADGESTSSYDKDEDLTLYAYWIKNTYRYEVTFMANDEESSNVGMKITVTYGEVMPDVEPSSNRNENYIFAGYFTERNCQGEKIYDENGKAVTKDGEARKYELKGDLTLYAGWMYSITYILNGGTNDENNPDSYTSLTETITLSDASKKGHVFGGWYTDEACTKGISEIVKGSIGTITLYAKWMITADPVATAIELLSGEGPHNIAVTGAITNETISAIRNALQNNSSAMVNLDLSETTGLTEIPDEAFDSCYNLTNVIIPNGVTTIGDNAFYACENLASITIPDGVTTIGSWAFYCCSNLTNVTIPDSVTSIGYYAFNNCDNLASITFADTNNWYYTNNSDYTDGTAIDVTDSTQNATYLKDTYYYCYWYKHVEITVTGDNAAKEISKLPLGSYTVAVTGAITNETISAIKNALQNNSSAMVSLDLSGTTGLTEIPDEAFDSCYNLTNVIIPDGVTSIGYSAFSTCSSLTSVTIPDSVTSIGRSAFSSCYNLTNVTIPDSVTSIGNSAFSSCYNLTNVTIPDSVTSIGNSAFCDCYNLTNVIIPDSVTTIGDYAFYNCENLASVTIPDSVTTIGDNAFYDCYRLASITFEDANNWYYTNNSDYTDGIAIDVTDTAQNAIYLTSTYNKKYWYKHVEITVTADNVAKEISKHPLGSYTVAVTGAITNETISAIKNALQNNSSAMVSLDLSGTTGLTEIPDEAFYDYDNLTNVIIPDSVTSIGDGAFSSCSSLTSVTIPESVTSIGDSAFSSCYNLTNVIIPDSVTTIGDYAFYYCNSLTKVTIPDSVITIGYYAFNNCDNLASITFADTNNWYYTSNSNYTGGTAVDVTDTHKNANNLSDSNNDSYYWYKTE